MPSLRVLDRIAQAFGVELVMFFLNVEGSERDRLAAAILRAPRSLLPQVAKAIGHR